MDSFPFIPGNKGSWSTRIVKEKDSRNNGLLHERGGPLAMALCGISMSLKWPWIDCSNARCCSSLYISRPASFPQRPAYPFPGVFNHLSYQHRSQTSSNRKNWLLFPTSLVDQEITYSLEPQTCFLLYDAHNGRTRDTQIPREKKPASQYPASPKQPKPQLSCRPVVSVLPGLVNPYPR